MIKYFTICFEPLDVLVFRDPRGMTAGAQHDVRSVGPGPQVMRGALRAALFMQLGADFVNRGKDHSNYSHYGIDERHRPWLGGRLEPGRLRLRGPFLVDRLGGSPRVWVPPAPGRRRAVQLEALKRDHPALAPRFSGEPTRALSLAGTPKDPKPPPWVLLGDEDAREDLPVKPERRSGLARASDGRRVVELELLYQEDVLRFAEGAGPAVELAVEDEAQADLVRALHLRVQRLGGRGHHARVHVLERPLLPAEAAKQVRLISPLLVHEGLAEALAALELRLLCTDDVEAHGGWDLGRRRPRPLHHALPPGTVLRFDQPVSPWTQTWGQPEEQAFAGYGSFIPTGDTPA